jgi:hypothetical protein
MRHHLALVACLAVSGSIAHAAPGRPSGRHGKVSKKAKHKPRVAPPVEQPADVDTDDDDDTADEAFEAPRLTKRGKRKRARAVEAREATESDSERIAFRGEAIEARDEHVVDHADAVEDDRAVVRDAPVRVRKAAVKPQAKDWHVAIGPYLWASSVDANVSLGSASVSAGVDFMDIQRHARYGVPVLAEVRYGRFAIYGDLLYGVVDVNGARDVGPLMVTLSGSASTLLVDGTAGYLLAGGEQSVLSLEARTGVRYQRTAIAGSVDVSGSDVSQPSHVDAAADMLAGAHVVVRPFRRFSVSGTIDLGVFGASTNSWSASTDASVRIGKHVLLSLGWRTFTTERTNVSIVMHGPRTAVQLMF